jgi:hypothetical protein
MKRVSTFFAIAALSFAAFAGMMNHAAGQPEKDKKPAFFCPVAGMPEAKSCACPGSYCSRRPTPQFTIDYKTAKIQLCCGECSKVMKESPAKFAAIANHQLVATSQARQIACPVCGGAAKVSGDVAGVKVMFCSETCAKKAADANLKDRVEMVFGDKAFARGFEIVAKK